MWRFDAGDSEQRSRGVDGWRRDKVTLPVTVKYKSDQSQGRQEESMDSKRRLRSLEVAPTLFEAHRMGLLKRPMNGEICILEIYWLF